MIGEQDGKQGGLLVSRGIEIIEAKKEEFFEFVNKTGGEINRGDEEQFYVHVIYKCESILNVH